MRCPDWPAIAAMTPDEVAAEIDEIEAEIARASGAIRLNTPQAAAIVFLSRHLTPEPQTKETRDHDERT